MKGRDVARQVREQPKAWGCYCHRAWEDWKGDQTRDGGKTTLAQCAQGLAIGAEGEEDLAMAPARGVPPIRKSGPLAKVTKGIRGGMEEFDGGQRDGMILGQ